MCVWWVGTSFYMSALYGSALSKLSLKKLQGDPSWKGQ
jgi:hypothetical protein